MSVDIEDDFDFGGCPYCGKGTTYLNVHKNHWFYCDTHKTRWCAGSGLFSTWEYEDENTWEENKRKLESYKVVEPIEMQSQVIPVN